MKERVFISIVIGLAALSGWLVSKSTSSSIEEATQEEDLNRFEIPTVFQPDAPLHLEPHKEYSIKAVAPSFLGVFPFTNALAILKDLPWPTDEEYLFHSEDSSDYYPAAGLQLIPVPKITLVQAEKYRLDDSAYFPVFIVNENNSTHSLSGKDSRVFAIQEALDSNGNWRPIERQAWGFCGNGWWGRKIMPKHSAVFSMPKYTGDFSTQLRIRLRSGSQTLVSLPFPGKINYQQFYLPEDRMLALTGYRKPWEAFISDCLGAVPLEYSQVE
ncbi:MAG: hypothetical protein KTR30_29455 [Saprospiraceae bacterium]|nr:hypothetical protein [Saprospiraceae bacterium]